MEFFCDTKKNNIKYKIIITIGQHDQQDKCNWLWDVRVDKSFRGCHSKLPLHKSKRI